MEPEAHYNVTRHLEGEKRKHRDLGLARDVSRKAILTIITLSSAIIAATFTLYSIPDLEEKFDLETIRSSWFAFVVTIGLGLLYLVVDGRLMYLEAAAKDYIQGMHVIPNNASLKRLVFKHSLWSLLWTKARDHGYSKAMHQTDDNSIHKDYQILEESYYRKLRHGVLAFEFVVYIAFVVGLGLLVASATKGPGANRVTVPSAPLQTDEVVNFSLPKEVK